MIAPTFVADYTPAVGWQSTAGTKTISVTAETGDVLVIVAASEISSSALATPTGGVNITWTLQGNYQVASNCEVDVWTTTISSGQTFTCSIINGGATVHWSYDVLRFSGSNGIGAFNKAQSTGAPSVSLTTAQSNSAVVAINSDFNAVDGTTRTWTTVNSITPTAGNSLERFYDSAGNAAVDYVTYIAYWNDAGTAGANSYGLSAPTGQAYSIMAVEVLGHPPTAPIVSSSAMTSITQTTAVGNGSVDSDGGDAITERGFCWGTSLSPTTANSKATAAGTTGSYTANLTGLNGGTTYYARAYAINSTGTSYGPNITFTTILTLSWFTI